MTAWTPTGCERLTRQLLLGGLLLLVAGCQGLGSKHAANRIPQYGCVDPNQPRELQMVSMPVYVVEPPDELDIAVRPAIADLTLNTVPVQADGNIDLGFLGDVYVAGLTLPQVEEKIALHIAAQQTKVNSRRPPQVSVRLVNGSSSKFYYVMGTVTTQGRFPSTGNDTVLDALMTAGLRTNSMPEKAYLVRPHPAGGPDQILKIDWFGIKDRGDTLTNYQVFPGDRIVVPGGKPPGLLSTLLGGG
ncbi:polysaccharide biosynthesis/export family protein [Singulisphaera sp. Ch08]|uniref:Polysaccharide biosynthesis/export family protein n=1 Tax=Singulisphaera sp. Ch08 TaxID=3120278 RepID=A0AAU7CF99_9BACT